MSVVGQIISLLESGAKTVRFETETSVYDVKTGVNVDNGRPDFIITKVEIKPGKSSAAAVGESARGNFLGIAAGSEEFGFRLFAGSEEGLVRFQEYNTSTVIKVH